MFKEKLANTPELPGSYQMKDKDGIIIYVGKAKNLKRRLKSYFTRTVTGGPMIGFRVPRQTRTLRLMRTVIPL